jgi:LytTr DNA-binding domain
MYILLLVAALPHLGERDIFRYNTVACATLFCLTLLLRPACRAMSARWKSSWLTLEGCAFVLSLLLGSLVTLVSGLATFGWGRLNGSNWMVSGVQAAVVLFLWCSLYFSIKNWQATRSERPVEKSGGEEPGGYAARFAVRAGSRIQVVSQDSVLWISAARDYVELHTRAGTHLLRETMHSLQQNLDPALFVRIHRSRIVRWDQIVELGGRENGEYLVKLRDGSEHRCSRTYAATLANWIGSD